MGNLKKSQLFVAAALSFGMAYGQSVVIEGGNIRVDASPGTKASATVKSDKNAAANKNKTVVTAGDTDTNVVIDGKKVVTTTTSNSATVQTNTGSQRAVVGGGSSTTVTNVGKATSVVSTGKGGKVLVNTDVSGQDLSRGGNYVGASFTNVEAVGTNFKGVDLSKAIMTNVDLSKADLRGANLTGAQMTNVDWEGALLDGAIWMDGRRCGPTSIGRCM